MTILHYQKVDGLKVRSLLALATVWLASSTVGCLAVIPEEKLMNAIWERNDTISCVVTIQAARSKGFIGFEAELSILRFLKNSFSG